MAYNVIKSSNKSIFNTYNFTVKEKKGINEYLSNTFYEKELKFKRSDTEVECLTSAVRTIVDKIMTAIGHKEPLFEISHKYLVGSIAEGTSIEEPDEFDFLVVLKHFSKPDAIRVDSGIIGNCLVHKNDIPLSLLETSQYVKIDNENCIRLKDYFLSEILKIVTSDMESLDIDTDHGNLSIKSTTVCHHGPASVVKLLWKPTSELSEPLDILGDITPCIEQQGIHTLIQASDVAISGHYEALISDDMYMLVPLVSYYGIFERTLFTHTFTTTEVKIVQTLSSHHKMCYLILKYCFTSIVFNDFNEVTGDDFYSLSSTYYIKTFVLRHAAKCKSEIKSHDGTGQCLITCIFDILDAMYEDTENEADTVVDGMFGKYTWFYRHYLPDSDSEVVHSVIDMLVEMGKNGYSEARHEEFRKVCARQQTGLARIYGPNEVECHIHVFGKCHMHAKIIYGGAIDVNKM